MNVFLLFALLSCVAFIDATETPTAYPTEVPTYLPSVIPTEAPTEVPEPTEVPAEMPTAVPTEAPTTPAFPFSCSVSGSFEVPVQPILDSCYPLIYIVGSDNPDTACFFEYNNASMASGAMITIPFSGVDSCGSVKTDTAVGIEKYDITITVRYEGCRAMDHRRLSTCEFNNLLEETVDLTPVDMIDIEEGKYRFYDTNVQVLSELHGAPLTANNSVLDGVPLYLNVSLKNVSMSSTAVLDFISVVLTPKYAQLDDPLVLYADDTTLDASAKVIRTHDHVITFKMESNFFFTAVTLKIIVSFENGARRRLIEITRNLQEEEATASHKSEVIVVLPRVLKTGDDDRVPTDDARDEDKGESGSGNLFSDSSLIANMGVTGGLLFGGVVLLLLIVGGAIIYLQLRGHGHRSGGWKGIGKGETVDVHTINTLSPIHTDNDLHNIYCVCDQSDAPELSTQVIIDGELNTVDVDDDDDDDDDDDEEER